MYNHKCRTRTRRRKRRKMNFVCLLSKSFSLVCLCVRWRSTKNYWSVRKRRITTDSFLTPLLFLYKEEKFNTSITVTICLSLLSGGWWSGTILNTSKSLWIKLKQTMATYLFCSYHVLKGPYYNKNGMQGYNIKQIQLSAALSSSETSDRSSGNKAAAPPVSISVK